VKPLRALAFFAAGIVVEWLWSTLLPVFGLAPRVVLILTISAASCGGSVAGQCYGFFWGLFLDILRPDLFGGNALVLLLAGYGTGVLRRQIDVTDPVSHCVVVCAMTCCCFLLYGLLGLVFAEGFLWPGWPAFLFDPLYNCLVVPFAALSVSWVRAR